MSNHESEDQLEEILATVDQWHEAFARSPEFAALTEAQRREAGAITEFFARYTHTHLGLAPTEWTGGAVWGCCTEILPGTISAGPDFFEAVAPVLSTFFKFIESRSLVPSGRALATVAASAHEDVVAHARDRTNWVLPNAL